ncbi:MAG: dipeptide epimerase [Rudaea sp.]|uniref:dipeptide epimerase n=1 Tax=Rudaea sp. TaxID=2136325 RepID=UPI0039E2FBDC
MSALALQVAVEKLKLAEPFHISGYVFEAQDAVVVTLDDGTHRGRGEASGVYYLGDNAPEMVAAIEANRGAIEAGIDRAALQALLPPGGARNALDCALWDLEAHRSGKEVWKLAGLDSVKPLVTTFTMGADEPAKMAAGARKFAQAKALKMKLTGEPDLDIARVRAVREARPEVWLGVDANQGYAIGTLGELIPTLVEAKVSLLEQPLQRGKEADLDGFASPVPIAADESALCLADVPGLIGRFNVVNIKLDKCGGLTEALAIAREARRLGLGVMVGNMVGTSWAMAPAFVVGQLCDIVDLDGPVFLAQDRTPSLNYDDGHVWVGKEVWGSRAAT